MNNILALLAYEYIVTFHREVNLFWTQKITMTSVLFLANRYIPLWAGLMKLPYELTLQASTVILIILSTTECSSSRTEVGESIFSSAAESKS